MSPLHSTLLAACLTTTAAASTLGAPNDSILSLVPEESFTLVYCEDFAAFRTRTESSEWRKLLANKTYAPLLAGLFQESQGPGGPGLQETLAIAQNIFGESVLFRTKNTTGFLTTPPLDRGPLEQALRAWDPSAKAQSSTRTLEISGGTVEIRTRGESTEDLPFELGYDKFTALVSHPEVVGYFSSDSDEALVAALEQSLAGIGSDRESSLVAAFRRESAARPHCSGVLTFTDFSPFVADAEDELKDLAEDVVGDPAGLLGLEEGTWLLTTSDVFAGSRVDCHGWLNIPKGSLAAKLADTFEPIAPDFAAELPRDPELLWMLNWDLAECYRRARAALEERNGAESLKPLDEGLQAAKAMTQTDLVRDVIEQLEGHLALYAMSSESKLGFEDGALLRLRDGDAMLRAFENLIDSGPLESELDLDTVEGVDVYSVDAYSGEPWFGLAFLPRAFAIVETGTLSAALRAATGVQDASLMSGSEHQGAFDRSQGSCSLALLRMRGLMRLMETMTRAPWETEEVASALDSPLLDSLMRLAVRRTETGFTFELSID